MRTPDQEELEMIKILYEKAVVKIFIKNKGNLLANAQVLIGGIQEYNGFTIWISKFDDCLNIQPPTYDSFHKCKAIWVRDKEIWSNLCKKIEREYLRVKEEQCIEDVIEDIPF